MPTLTTFLATRQSFEIPAGTSFLAFCQSHDAPHDFGCTVGSCGRVIIESGAENVDPVTDEERKPFAWRPTSPTRA
jgi:ferredoxin